MPDVFDKDGNLIGDIPVSAKQLAILERGEGITVIYHTPQLLRHVLGEQSGAFSLQKEAERIVTQDTDALKQYAKLQKAIQATRAEGE